LVDANSYCQIIYNDITNPTSALYSRLRTVGPPSVSSKSNNGLYALFALLAIPVLIVIGIVIAVLLKSRPRHAHSNFIPIEVPSSVADYPVKYGGGPYHVTAVNPTPNPTPNNSPAAQRGAVYAHIL
jgi:hypothetical protein